MAQNDRNIVLKEINDIILKKGKGCYINLHWTL